MEDREAALLFSALCYEQGHARRTQHILKVYALAQMLARRAALPVAPPAGMFFVPNRRENAPKR